MLGPHSIFYLMFPSHGPREWWQRRRILAAEYDNHPLWPRYVAILQFILDGLKGEEVFWVTEEA